MKKLALLILLVVSTVIVIGCDPNNYDVTSSYWRHWAEGKIIGKSTEKHPTVKSRRIVRFQLLGGDEIMIGALYEPEKVKVGQVGNLYKYTEGGYNDEDSTFRWIVSKDVPSSETVKPEYPDKEGPLVQSVMEEMVEDSDLETSELSLKSKKDIGEFYEKRYKEYDWQPVIRSLPKAYTTVLVKLNDGIVTTAYIHNSGDWKLEIYKKQFSGGISLSNVIEWRELDLD